MTAKVMVCVSLTPMSEPDQNPSNDREKLVERLMESDGLSREQANEVVEAHLLDRSNEIDPALLDGLDLA